MQSLVNGTGVGAAQGRLSLSGSAYVAIRDMLIRVEIRPGAPVHEDQLSKQLGIGRTPVREALKRLESERLVNIFPRRGVFATDVHLTDLSLLTEVRTHLEGEAAYRAARRARGEQRDRLRQLVADADGRERDIESQIDFDIQVHRTIYECANNPFLKATLTQYHNLILRIWYLFIDRLPEMTDHVAEVVPILQAVLAEDAETARERSIDHVTRFERAVMASL